jgi:hypothetical protein
MPGLVVTTLAEADLVGAQANEMAGLDPASRTKLHIRPARWSRNRGRDCACGNLRGRRAGLRAVAALEPLVPLSTTS